MNTFHSSEFKQSELQKYDNDTGNPVEHLIYFKSKLMLHTRDGVLMCKLFPTIL